MVSPASHRISRVPWYSRSTAGVLVPFADGAITLYGVVFHGLGLRRGFVTPWGRCSDPYRALQPPSCNGCTLGTGQVWAFPRSLATTKGIVSFPRGTKMFQFPRFPPTPYGFRCGYLGMTPGGFPHSGTPGSQLARQLTGAYRSHATPFFGLWRQGIHRMLLVACYYARALARLKFPSMYPAGRGGPTTCRYSDRLLICVSPRYSVVNVLIFALAVHVWGTGQLHRGQRSNLGQRNRLANLSSRPTKRLELLPESSYSVMVPPLS